MNTIDIGDKSEGIEISREQEMKRKDEMMGRNVWMVGCLFGGWDGLAIGMIWIDSKAHGAGFANQHAGCKTHTSRGSTLYLTKIISSIASFVVS